MGVDYTAYNVPRTTRSTGDTASTRRATRMRNSWGRCRSIQSVPHTTDPGTGLRDYYDFATYNQSTQGHLNSDGLCFVKRHYPSPQ